MKLIFASDLHGSLQYTEKLLEAFERENASRLFLLGDIYNHGPRNPLPERYAPMEVANLLNGMQDKVFAICGNCDSDVDKMISNFQFTEDSLLFIENKAIYLQHGDRYSIENLPKVTFDIFIY